MYGYPVKYQKGKWERRCGKRRDSGKNDAAFAFIREDEVPTTVTRLYRNIAPLILLPKLKARN